MRRIGGRPCDAKSSRTRRRIGVASALATMKLEDLHLYRKVPRDLTDATAVGGAISLSCALVMAFLFISNIQTCGASGAILHALLQSLTPPPLAPGT